MTSKTAIEVTWSKDKDVIESSSKYELHDLGREHRLTVHDLCMSDYGDYAVSIRSLRKPPHSPGAVGSSSVLLSVYFHPLITACKCECFKQNILKNRKTSLCVCSVGK